jgi:hypothetical protein
MKKEINDYLESMIYDFSNGNDNEYGIGNLVEFRYEEIEKGDLEIYDEEDVNMFYEVREYISEVKEVNYLCGDDKIEYKFIVEENDIVCSFIEIY